MSDNLNLKINDLYKKILLREADVDGLQFWKNQILNKNMSLTDIENCLYNSKEFEQIDPKYNFSSNNEEEGFFDDYPNFYKTSQTVEHPNHLNGRFKAIIESNLDIIKNSSILDIACHDGRWSFAALKNGAKSVIGIEARQHLVDNANENMQTYGIPQNSFQFIKNDIHQEIKKLEPNQFDIVFCLDFLYHTIDHWFLLSQIKRLNPKFIVIDTRIDLSDERIIKLHMDYSEKEAHAATNDLHKTKILVGTPSRSSLEMMLTCLGFDNIEYFDWKKNVINFKNLVDYYHGKRVTLRAKNN
jgi:2-polyprenyl-3-methyl-5-hydroxy-6-metoxy-1,4-benzoquinol methylase